MVGLVLLQLRQRLLIDARRGGPRGDLVIFLHLFEFVGNKKNLAAGGKEVCVCVVEKRVLMLMMTER
jgi:hypothetical protein